jgi:thiamine biosynthesis lipoprotein
VQPLWRAYEAHFWSRAQIAPDIAARAAEVARRLVDYRRVQAGAARISLAPGMAITLNGIAQGTITDRVADLVRNEGFEQAVVGLGEWRALGVIRTAVRGVPRRARATSISPTMPSRCHPAPARRSSRAENSITSSIRRPARARCAARGRRTAARAMVADALATAILCRRRGAAARLLAAYPERAGPLIHADDGTTASLGGA